MVRICAHFANVSLMRHTIYTRTHINTDKTTASNQTLYTANNSLSKTESLSQSVVEEVCKIYPYTVRDEI